MGEVVPKGLDPEARVRVLWRKLTAFARLLAAIPIVSDSVSHRLGALSLLAAVCGKISMTT